MWGWSWQSDCLACVRPWVSLAPQKLGQPLGIGGKKIRSTSLDFIETLTQNTKCLKPKTNQKTLSPQL